MNSALQSSLTIKTGNGLLCDASRLLRRSILNLSQKETMIKKTLIIFCGLALAASILNCKDTGTKTDGYTIAVIPKGTTHEFWKSIHAGAVKAQQEFNSQGVKVSIIWKGPLKEDDREEQIKVVEGFRSQNVSGIVLAPLDNRALVRPVEEAKQSNIPTIVIDSGLASDSIVSFVATDNLKGGSLAADRIGTLLQGKGKVLLLRYQVGSASTQDREDGFVKRDEIRLSGNRSYSRRCLRGSNTRDGVSGVAESA